MLGQSHQRHSPLLTLALDRIQLLCEEPSESYQENSGLDLSTYYDDVIGVTKTAGQRNTEVIFRIEHAHAPYVITKPIHSSQKLLGSDAEGKIFSIRVVLNFELERELLGFGAKITVFGPRILKKQILEQLTRAAGQYNSPEKPL